MSIKRLDPVILDSDTTVTPTVNKIPRADGSGYLDSDWIPMILRYVIQVAEPTVNAGEAYIWVHEGQLDFKAYGMTDWATIGGY